MVGFLFFHAMFGALNGNNTSGIVGEKRAYKTCEKNYQYACINYLFGEDTLVVAHFYYCDSSCGMRTAQSEKQKFLGSCISVKSLSNCCGKVFAEDSYKDERRRKNKCSESVKECTYVYHHSYMYKEKRYEDRVTDKCCSVHQYGAVWDYTVKYQSAHKRSYDRFNARQMGKETRQEQ